jgi:hypothetical protein
MGLGKLISLLVMHERYGDCKLTRTCPLAVGSIMADMTLTSY